MDELETNEFHALWKVLEPEVCMRVKTHNTHSLEDYEPLEPDCVIEFINKLLEKRAAPLPEQKK